MAERSDDERTARRPAHPARETLLRFAHGEATSEETRAVVRHLISGCHRCSAIVGPELETTERLARRRAAQPQLAGRRG